MDQWDIISRKGLSVDSTVNKHLIRPEKIPVISGP